VHDVIVVTINYRLGLFGFLTTGDSNALGNYGLWDQTAALKWTNENINQFGGNPNQITVLGHSAGASSTDLLCISPHSRGYLDGNNYHTILDLFKNAAPMAGSSFNKWALTQSQKTLNKALKLAQKRGFVSTNLSNQNTELVKFLRKLPADQIKVAAHGLPVLENEDAIAMHVAPVFDGDFFPRPLNELRKEAPKKDILTGVTTFEGLMFGKKCY
jgi:carboxylesterase 2